jgi:hypothetical protein
MQEYKHLSLPQTVLKITSKKWFSTEIFLKGGHKNTITYATQLEKAIIHHAKISFHKRLCIYHLF